MFNKNLDIDWEFYRQTLKNVMKLVCIRFDLVSEQNIPSIDVVLNEF